MTLIYTLFQFMSHYCIYLLQDYLQLGPLELKLLSIRGEKLDIRGPGSKSSLNGQDPSSSEWPYTRTQIVAKLK